MRVYLTNQSSAVSEMAFDPESRETMVLVTYETNREITYEYGPWPTHAVKAIKAPGESVGQGISVLRKAHGEHKRRLPGTATQILFGVNAGLLPAGRQVFAPGATGPLAF